MTTLTMRLRQYGAHQDQTLEARAREIGARMGWEEAWATTSGDVVELANLLSCVHQAADQIEILENIIQQLKTALEMAHLWLKTVEDVRIVGGSYMGLDHKAGDYEECSLCTALKAAKEVVP